MSGQYQVYRKGGGGGYGTRADDDYDPFGDSYPTDGYRRTTDRATDRTTDQTTDQTTDRSTDHPQGGRYNNRSRPGSPPQNGLGMRQAVSSRRGETDAERQIGEVLEHIRQEWPSMLQNDCVPVQLALQLLDNSSVGRAHDYRKFQKTHDFLQSSLKNIVHEHHQGFNSSIGTFHKIQGSIQTSQKRVRLLKDALASARTSLCTTDPELKKLSAASSAYDELLQTLGEVEELRLVPDQLEARISEKRFLTAVEVLQGALRKLRKPELSDIGALADLRAYLVNQETALMDILVEELHEHLYLKSPYCQERWQILSKTQGTFNGSYSDAATALPFHQILDSIDFERPVVEDPAKNPEADTFYYIGLLVEALNKLGRLQNAVDTLKQILPVELFTIVTETVNEVDDRHLTSLRGGSGHSQGFVYGSRETQLRAEVIYDLLWTLFGKFEAIAEGQRVFHDSIKALIRREGAGNNSALLGSFKELWNLYQNEIRTLLHNYVTTDADVYRFDTSVDVNAPLSVKKDYARENLFKLTATDAKSPGMANELEALEGIIEAAVPGLTSTSRKQGAEKKPNVIGNRSESANSKKGPDTAFSSSQQQPGGHKSLVEPSVFNMSLLLPLTLTFLQRLKNIVPPGSDLATSTLTTFLDNFLVNVFQPQLDETLGKLSDTIFSETKSFLQDQDWKVVAKRPVFKGCTDFFNIVTAFCRMLGTIPHDQALSSLIVTQMMRYHERCLGWYKSLVSKTQEQATDAQELKVSATMALHGGEIHDTMKRLWESSPPSSQLLDLEVQQLISRTDKSRFGMSDVIQDRDVISSLCLLYTSMNWLTVRISGLRHITREETDSSRSNIPRQPSKRWTLMNDPAKVVTEQGSVVLPMTQETVQAFDNIVGAYQDLAATALLTLHMEARCQIVYSLGIALSPETAPYLLDQDVSEPDPQILDLNSELVAYDETIVRFLRERETTFIRKGLGRLVDAYLVANAIKTSPMNDRGCRRMHLNILVLQQNLKNIEDGVNLSRAFDYYGLFEKGADAVVEKAKESAGKGAEDTEGTGGEGEDGGRYSYNELKAMLELCFSEQLANPERGIAAAAKRRMAEKMLSLEENMWQG